MCYQQAIQLIRDAARQVNPTGTFIHARRTDGSINYHLPLPQIHLYPIDAETDTTHSYTTRYNILMGFWWQDSPDSSPQQMEELIHRADNMVRRFILALDENDTVEIAGLKTEPNYRQLSGTLTGLITRFTLTLTTDVC